MNYCRVNEVFDAIPSAFGATRIVKSEVLPEDLLDRGMGSFLITAPAGFGKTSFCKWSAISDLHRLEDRSSTTIPVYVPLHQLATAMCGSLQDAFFRSHEAAQLVAEAREAAQPIRVYLDGLDEVPNTEQQRKLMQLASQITAQYPTAQVIVTGRGYVSGAWLRWLPRIFLAELNNQQVDELISKWFADEPNDLTAFQTQISASEPLNVNWWHSQLSNALNGL